MRALDLRSVRSFLRALAIALAAVAVMVVALPPQALGACDECEEEAADTAADPCAPASDECEDCASCQRLFAIGDVAALAAPRLSAFVIAREAVIDRAPLDPAPHDILVVPRA